MRKWSFVYAAISVLAFGLMAQQMRMLADSPPPRPPTASPRPSEQGDAAPAAKRQAGIQWYPTWQSGIREAQRTGRPILLVAGAPHCAGVSGIW
jgi:hypothetical protein